MNFRAKTSCGADVAVATATATHIPPVDDWCPICLGEFEVPCRASCGHWYCGGCILQHWNHGKVFEPCSCPMCKFKFTSLTPETLSFQEPDATNVLIQVDKYNRLFGRAGGLRSLYQKGLNLLLFLKKMACLPVFEIFNDCMAEIVGISGDNSSDDDSSDDDDRFHQD